MIGDSKNEENAKLWGKCDLVGIKVRFFYVDMLTYENDYDSF